MKILFYALNYQPELIGCGKYSGELGGKLSQAGYDIRVITTPPYYPNWKVASSHQNRYSFEKLDGVCVYRSPLYVPSNPTTLRRLAHLLSFAISSIPQLFRNLFWKPDVVLVVEPTFFCVPAALFFARLTGAKTWLHIQDFELDAMLGLGMFSQRQRLVEIARRLEIFFMRRFTRVSTIANSMVKKLELKQIPRDKIYYLPNWVDVQALSPDADRSYYRQKWAFEDGDIIFLYSGNIGKKQGLDLIIKAAVELEDHTSIKFVVVGHGAFKHEFENLVKKSGVGNISIHDLQPYEKLPDLLRMADFHLVMQLKGAADAVLPSKLTSILAVGGTAIITAHKDTELGQFVMNNPEAAILVEPEEKDKFVECIKTMTQNYEYQGYNKVARAYAQTHLSIHKIVSDLGRELVRMK